MDVRCREEVFEGALLSMHELPPYPDARPDPRRRWKWLGVLSAAALLLHAADLSGLGGVGPSREVPAVPAASVQVRVVDAVPPVALAAAELSDPEPTAPQVEAPPPRAKVASTRAAPVQLALNTPVTNPTPAPAPAAAAAPGDEPTPHYRTRMPPATTLRYEMRRGFLSGVGDLSWRPQGDHYELKLEASVSGLPVLTQVSAGGFDADGVAPVRFTDQRLRRGTAAANFQRAAGKITFSGPSTEFALRDGAQDRLSWMVQLAAIVAAEPQLSVAGARVVMYVVGSHGDADVWVFRCMGPEAVSTGVGTTAAIKFMREPREAYDTSVQVWLDPHRHSLPVRALQKSGSNDEVFDLHLREVIHGN
jgi:hypothetical protein